MLRLRLPAILLCAFTATACVAAPEFASAPTLSPNPNTQAPLVALIDFESANASSTRVAIDDGDRRWHIDFPRVASPDAPLIILGMRPGRQHTITVSIIDSQGDAVSAEPLTFATPPLPLSQHKGSPPSSRANSPSSTPPGSRITSHGRLV